VPGVLLSDIAMPGEPSELAAVVAALAGRSVVRTS
jgi:hypothetical protein